ncbi:MAG: SprT-like domain-containing protein [Armatimonadetes bacterium]|nr:SprT-like domain-containing protein [Armatimonadota bacterium]
MLSDDPNSPSEKKLTETEQKALTDALLLEVMRDFPIPTAPKIVWKNLRVSAGLALYLENEIRLSKRILDTEDKVRETFLHEYAHLLAFARHGRAGAGHGKPWKDAMRELGLDPQVRHRYAVERNEKRQQVLYVCKRCGLEFVRGRRFPRGRRVMHVSCGGLLKLVGLKRKDL